MVQTAVLERRPNLRERKKAETRRALQREALRLFTAQGYEATTVEQIAAAANVSAMTFFRYFPSKEDVVLADEYDALLAAHLAAQPADATPLDKIRWGVRDSLALVYAEARDDLLVRIRLILATPALRARLFANQGTTADLLARSFGAGSRDWKRNLRAKVIAAACLAAMTEAILLWAQADGVRPLPELIDRAFDVLRRELTPLEQP
jgi:AcrR family transcriptional regulator